MLLLEKVKVMKVRWMAYQILHFAHWEESQVAGVIAHRTGTWSIGQLEQFVEDVVVDDGFGVAVRNGEFAAGRLFAAGRAGPDVVF